ncbi:replication initiation protein A [Helicobacter gastrofelis]|uniref:replication initiation protein A n=1 Tax=Helicobacter gastrofelis TaxID=2849642 RepID=UPI001C863989|nr:replication initiation protein A [Helicobacter sp. NHP19-012]
MSTKTLSLSFTTPPTSKLHTRSRSSNYHKHPRAATSNPHHHNRNLPTRPPTAQQQPITTEVITQNTPTIPTAVAEKYVTFHNDVNSVSLGKLGTLEANLLFAIFHKLKDRQDELLVFF